MQQSKIAGPAQSFLVKPCALSVFRKAGGTSGPAQKNNPKAIVLIERARRIKFDDSDRHRPCDVAGFCKQLAKTGSPISASGDGADDEEPDHVHDAERTLFLLSGDVSRRCDNSEPPWGKSDGFVRGGWRGRRTTGRVPTGSCMPPAPSPTGCGWRRRRRTRR